VPTPLIPGLHGSMTHRLAVVLYQRHRVSSAGACDECNDPAPCRTRRHAEAVIRAAGDAPRPYDTPPKPTRTNTRSPRCDADTTALPAYAGFHVGPRPDPSTWDGYFYERDIG
jgi:hypothetical protein